MADTIERLYKLTVDGTSAARSLAAIAQSTDALDKRLAGAISSVQKFGASLGAALSVGAVVGAIKRNVDAMDDLWKSVQKVGIAAEDLQKLRYAADLSGVSAEALDKAMATLASTMFDLETGTTDAHKALRAIGVQSGDSPVKALEKIADQFAKMPEDSNRAALAIQIFTKKIGPDMIPLLLGGAKGLKQAGDELAKMGVILNAGTLKAAEAFNDSLTKINTNMGGVVKQLTAGMLPYLQTLSARLLDATVKGDGFVTTGARIGEMLVDVAKLAVWSGAQLQRWAILAKANFEVLKAPWKSGEIFGGMFTDLAEVSDELNRTLKKMDRDLAKFKREAAKPVETPKPGTDPVTELLKAQEAAEAAAKKKREAEAAAAKAAAERRKIEDKAWKEQGQQLEAEELALKAVDDALTARNETLTTQQRVIMEVGKAHKEYLDNIEKEGALQQYLIDLTDESTEAYQNASEGLRAYARAQLAAEKVAAQTTAGTIKQSDELKKVNDAFEDFFDAMFSGAMNVEQAFKRMAQQIVADLLKIWAKKYIIDAIMRMFGYGGMSGDGGANVGPFPNTASVAMPFSSGPSISPLATASTFASVAPVRFGPSGFGMPQQQQAPMQVTINNNAPGVQVETRQTPDGLDVLITQVKQSLAADVLRGGTDFARASERAWGLTRGNAAAF